MHDRRKERERENRVWHWIPWHWVFNRDWCPCLILCLDATGWGCPLEMQEGRRQRWHVPQLLSLWPFTATHSPLVSLWTIASEKCHRWNLQCASLALHFYRPPLSSIFYLFSHSVCSVSPFILRSCCCQSSVRRRWRERERESRRGAHVFHQTPYLNLKPRANMTT